jgi:hypothetical protein
LKKENRKRERERKKTLEASAITWRWEVPQENVFFFFFFFGELFSSEHDCVGSFDRSLARSREKFGSIVFAK